MNNFKIIQNPNNGAVIKYRLYHFNSLTFCPSFLFLTKTIPQMKNRAEVMKNERKKKGKIIKCKQQAFYNILYYNKTNLKKKHIDYKQKKVT